MLLFGTNLFQISHCLLVPISCRFVVYLWVLCANFIFRKLVTNQLLGRKLCVVQPDTLYLHQDNANNRFLHKISVLLWLIIPSETENSRFLELLLNWNPSIMFLLKFVQVLICSRNFDFMNRFENNCTKDLLIFENSCAEICNAKGFVDIVTAGRHHELSNTYVMHNLFHRNKLPKDVELQNTHIVLFESPRDVVQVRILSAQFVFG